MKILIALIFFSNLALAQTQSIRQQCEDAHYATDYVKLHQYRLIIDWSKISDHNHVKMENILYGDSFKVLKEMDINSKETIFHFKEIGNFSPYRYEHLLYLLEEVSMGKVSCLYNI